MIKVRNVFKKYQINPRIKTTLRDTMNNIWKISSAGQATEIWALNDVTFDVAKGEVVSLIGGNGSGKSTLLKVLSKVTKPTRGHAEIRGKLSALLEVGAGFHPELTGRENIYLNGSLLGMTRQEVRSKLDEIVAFAELESHLDIVVKYYSSGMYVRLAFAIAAHLDSGILLLDEVLAVGDAAFQKKCLNQIERLTQSLGRTVIFVSHDLKAVERISSRALLLINGELVKDGPTRETIAYYLKSGSIKVKPVSDRIDRRGNGLVTVVDCQINGLSMQPDPVNLRAGEDADITFVLRNHTQLEALNVSLVIGLKGPSGQLLVWLSNQLHQDPKSIKAGESERWIFSFKNLPLAPGPYTLNTHCRVNSVLSDWVENTISFTVAAGGNFYPLGRIPPIGAGLFYLDHNFRIEKTL